MTDNSDTLLLRGVRVVLPTRVTDKANILVEDGRIALVEEGGVAFPIRSMRTIELDGATFWPGFIDVHIHGAVGVDTMEADAEDLHRAARFLAQHGTTSWLPTLVPAPREHYVKAAKAINELMQRQDSSEGGARALGVHYEGPFVNTAQCGALRSEYFQSYQDPSTLDSLAVIDHPAARHMMTLAPEIAGAPALIRELVKRGWTVSIGHTRASVNDLDVAREAGARHMTHFMNAMSSLHHRAPGPIGWGLVNDDVTCDVIADGVHVDRLMLKLLLRCKGADRLSLISDAVSPAGMGEGNFKVWGETITVERGRTRNARGSIAGSVITMLDAVRMMLALGVGEVEVARMASTNPARLLGMAEECGSIEEGKRADLAALDADGNVRLTLVNGRIVFEG